MTAASTLIGTPIRRIDGIAKVTGQAKYSAEFKTAGLAHGIVVSSAITKGRIKKIDAREALAVDGVVAVLTHKNRPTLARFSRSYKDDIAPDGAPFRPLYDDKIRFAAQPIALVVAEELEIARFAASLVRVEYERDLHATDLLLQRDQAYDAGSSPKPRGDAETAFKNAAVRFEAEYWSPVEHHNPMELNAATVIWEGDGKLTIYDKTQGVQNNRNYVMNVFSLSEQDVRVLSPFVGGAFGSALRPRYQLPLAVMAARQLERSVRVTLTRHQMFTLGYRPGVLQRVALGAHPDGTLASIMHDALAMTSQYEDFTENVVPWAGVLYRCPNTKFTYRLAKLDLVTPCDMRAPGGASGAYALECAMDELAAELKIDPLELRLKNYSDRDQNENKPFSSKALRDCYRQGAEKFGWSGRNPQPRSMRDGNELVGWGLATGIWEAMQQKASAKALLTANGSVEIASATSDIGPGTYTMMTQLAAEMLGVPLANVTAKLGDSTLPQAPVEGGSFTTSSVGSAIHTACHAVREKVLLLAQKVPSSPLANAKLEDVTFSDGMVRLTIDPAQGVAIGEAMRHGDVSRIEEEGSAEPGDNKHAHYTHSAVFAEVKVDEQLGVVRVTRVVNAVAAGRILNPVTSRSQILGGVVWGIGMALHEETMIDHDFGRFINNSLGEYHLPVNADIHDIDVIFVDEPDATINPLGVKGVGEIGIVGTAAAVANAIYHATGKRVRDLPITLDKIIGEA